MSVQKKTFRRVIVIAMILSCHCAVLGFEAFYDSPTWDEVGHFAAGLEHWHHFRFSMFRVNPPLVRLVALASVAFRRPDLDPDKWGAPRGPFERPEFLTGARIAKNAGGEYFRLMSVARWSCIPLSVIGGLACFRWAYLLFGYESGVLSLLLWCASPTVIAYGHLITPDLGAAALGVAAALCFRQWIGRPEPYLAFVAGCALGAVELAKTTWIILFLLWPLLWLLSRKVSQRPFASRELISEACQVLLMIGVAVCVINVGYGCEGTGTRLGDYRFTSMMFRGTSGSESAGGNRFSATAAAAVPVPLPANYVLGIDLQRRDFEKRMLSYLNGEWRLGGWWYYYLVAVLMKEPLGFLLLGAAGLYVFAAQRRDFGVAMIDEALIVVPLVAVFTFVSSQTGFSHHIRYVLPAFPFCFVFISRLGRVFKVGGYSQRIVVGLLVAFGMVSSAAVFPHSLSYFSVLAGGPRNGHWWLNNSNADWGQDLRYLRTWLDVHPESVPICLKYDMALIDPSLAGIKWKVVPVGPQSTENRPAHVGEFGPQPGWFAISVNQLHNPSHLYDYFNDLKPVDWVGYTLPVYHVSLGDANRLREKYGLPKLGAVDTDFASDNRRPAHVPSR